MNAEQRIKRLLRLKPEELRATQVWHGYGEEGRGWYVKQFGEQTRFLGKTLAEIEEDFKWEKGE